MRVTTEMFRRESTRAVVLAVNGDWATLMSPDGAFRRVRARSAWRVGDDVLVASETTALRRAAPWLGSVGAAVAAAAVTFGVMSTLAANRTVLYVEINGSHPARLAVNANGLVLSALSENNGPLPVRVRRGEPLAKAVGALARAEAATAGGFAEGGVLVDFYAPKGSHPSANIANTVEMAASAAGAVVIPAVTAVTAGAAATHTNQGAAAKPPGAQALERAVGPGGEPA